MVLYENLIRENIYNKFEAPKSVSYVLESKPDAYVSPDGENAIYLPYTILIPTYNKDSVTMTLGLCDSASDTAGVDTICVKGIKLYDYCENISNCYCCLDLYTPTLEDEESVIIKYINLRETVTIDGLKKYDFLFVSTKNTTIKLTVKY